jgi:hypothetical protein
MKHHHFFHLTSGHLAIVEFVCLDFYGTSTHNRPYRAAIVDLKIKKRTGYVGSTLTDDDVCKNKEINKWVR